MRDERLDWDNFEVVQHRVREREAEDALLSALPDLSPLQKGLHRWWCCFVEQTPTASFSASDLSRPAARLQSHMPTPMDPPLVPLLEAVSRVINGENSHDLIVRVARRLLAEAVGYVSALGPQSMECVLRATEFCHVRIQNWSDFRDSFVATCNKDPQRCDGWLQTLGEIPDDLESYYLAQSDEHNLFDTIETEEIAFRKSGDLARVWRRPAVFVQIRDNVITPLLLLAALDRSALLTALERIPSIYLMFDIVEHLRLSAERDWVLSALLEAAPVFSEQGFTGNRTLLVVVDAILQHGLNLEHAVAQAARMGYSTAPPADQILKSLHTSELPSWFRSAFGTLLVRPDGKMVAIEFAAHLVTEAQFAKGLQDDSWPAPLVALNELLDELRRHGVQLLDVKTTMMRSHRRSEMPFLITGCEVEFLAEGGAVTWSMRSNELREDSWQWYERMLAADDEGTLSQVNPYNVVHWPFITIGAVLLGFCDPVAQWLQSWNRLFEKRFRARFCLEARLLESSLHLVRVGIGAIDTFLNESSKLPSDGCNMNFDIVRGHAQRLWHQLCQCLQYLVIGQAGPELYAARRDLARIFAYMPALFGVTLATEIDSVVPLMKSDARLTIRILDLLLRNGVMPNVITDIMARHEMVLEAIAEEAIHSATVQPGLEPEGNTDKMVRNLLNELGKMGTLNSILSTGSKPKEPLGSDRQRGREPF